MAAIREGAGNWYLRRFSDASFYEELGVKPFEPGKRVRATPLVASVLLEPLMLALAAALAGGAFAWAVFDGSTVKTLGGAGIADVIFHLHIGVGLLSVGLVSGA